MSQIGLHRECDDLERIIEDLAAGKETCEIGDTRYTFEDALDYGPASSTMGSGPDNY